MKRNGMETEGTKESGKEIGRIRKKVLLGSIGILIIIAGFGVLRWAGRSGNGSSKGGDEKQRPEGLPAWEADREAGADGPEAEEGGAGEAVPVEQEQSKKGTAERAEGETGRKGGEQGQNLAKSEESRTEKRQTEKGTEKETEEKAEAVKEEIEALPEAEERGVKSPAEEAEVILEGMELEEKVAQMFFITPELITGVSCVTAAGEKTKAALDRYPVGGFIYMARNLENAEQTGQMLSCVQEYMMEKCGFPVFLGVDEEGGRVLRIGSNAKFGVEETDAMGALAKEENPEAVVRNAGNTIGKYLSELGFNVDFAPDADVLTNDRNRVIGDRSFGKDSGTVAGLAWEFAQGLHDNGIMACYKHFPGHGGTVEDSHEGYAYSYKTWEELEETELVPFRSGSRNGIEFIMVSHISLPSFQGTNLPATLSESVVTGKLREEIGYEGIIITDSMNMGAVSRHYAAGEAAVMAVQAGCDMLLMSQGFEESYLAVLEALETGEISEKRIDESVRRILEAKLKWRNAYWNNQG